MVRIEVFKKLNEFEFTCNLLPTKLAETKGTVDEPAYREAIVEARKWCSEATTWCQQKRDAFRKEIDANDPAQKFTKADLMSREQFCAEAESVEIRRNLERHDAALRQVHLGVRSRRERERASRRWQRAIQSLQFVASRGLNARL